VTATTIKLETGLRDRLNAEARRRGVPVGSFVEELFALWLREQRFADLRSALASHPRDARAAAEDLAWDALPSGGAHASPGAAGSHRPTNA
jgi:hypothetical protein